jgi:hypothetical protein
MPSALDAVHGCCQHQTLNPVAARGERHGRRTNIHKKLRLSGDDRSYTHRREFPGYTLLLFALFSLKNSQQLNEKKPASPTRGSGLSLPERKSSAMHHHH